MRHLARVHHGLAQRVGPAGVLPPVAVLDLGAAVLFHGAVEQDVLFPFNRLLDPEVQSECAARHAQLAEDLGLLESLLGSDPQSPDIPILSAALLGRIKEHIARDERLFYHAVPDDLAG